MLAVVIKIKIMLAKDKLRKIYPDCFCSRGGYRQPYLVYDSVHTKNILGQGNTLKNAYNNALSSVGK